MHPLNRIAIELGKHLSTRPNAQVEDILEAIRNLATARDGYRELFLEEEDARQVERLKEED